MANGLRWWVIPGAMFVLLGVLTLGQKGAAESGSRPGGAVVDVDARAREVAAREATIRRQRWRLVDEFDRGLIMKFRSELAEQRVGMQIWQRIDGRRQAEPWLSLRPRVRADGTIPMAGLTAGCYDIEVELASGERLVAECVEAPGIIAFPTGSSAAPGR